MPVKRRRLHTSWYEFSNEKGHTVGVRHLGPHCWHVYVGKKATPDRTEFHTPNYKAASLFAYHHLENFHDKAE